MSERDSVHKEIEKLQEEVGETKKKVAGAENKTRSHEDEVRTYKSGPGVSFFKSSFMSPLQRRKLLCQVEMLKREIEQSLSERDKALKENQELR